MVTPPFSFRKFMPRQKVQKVQKVRLKQFKNDVKTIFVIALEMFLVTKLTTKQSPKNIHFVRIISFCKRIQNVVRKTFYSSRNISVLAISNRSLNVVNLLVPIGGLKNMYRLLLIPRFCNLKNIGRPVP